VQHPKAPRVSLMGIVSQKEGAAQCRPEDAPVRRWLHHPAVTAQGMQSGTSQGAVATP